MAEIMIEAVRRIRLAAVKEYILEPGVEHDHADDRFFRILSIETESGTLDVELSAMTWDALELVHDV